MIITIIRPLASFFSQLFGMPQSLKNEIAQAGLLNSIFLNCFEIPCMKMTTDKKYDLLPVTGPKLKICG